MAAQQETVVPVGTDWVAKVSGSEVSPRRRRQADAIDDARAWLELNGGGELVVLGQDGRTRQKDTIGRPDPRSSRG